MSEDVEEPLNRFDDVPLMCNKYPYLIILYNPTAAYLPPSKLRIFIHMPDVPSHIIRVNVTDNGWVISIEYEWSTIFLSAQQLVSPFSNLCESLILGTNRCLLDLRDGLPVGITKGNFRISLPAQIGSNTDTILVETADCKSPACNQLRW
jgi:hypothetical protein